MCTVIFIPLQDGVLLSSNRDESPAREKALTPMVHKGITGDVLCPVDPAGGGTWIGAHEKGHILILLNGGRIKHERQASYRCSRGLIVKELLNSADPLASYQCIDLVNTEPFTLVLWQEGLLYELLWDGQQKYITTRDKNDAHIWSSSTLYTEGEKCLREQWFAAWLATRPVVDAASLRAFLNSHQDPHIGFVMNRHGLVKTLSISTIYQDNNDTIFEYYETGTGGCTKSCMAAKPAISCGNTPAFAKAGNKIEALGVLE